MRLVADCCSPGTYGAFFDEKLAAKDARRYRRKGITGVTKRLVEAVSRRGVDGADVVEIGGGIGALHVELLKRGAVRAANVELSPAYEDIAQELLRAHGLADRVERRVGDVAQNPDSVGAADVVVLNRVVCCYPDYDALLGTAAAKARRLVGFSYPPDFALARVAIRLVNLWPRLRGCEFRAYVHPEHAMLATIERRGFRVAERSDAGVWRVAVLERA